MFWERGSDAVHGTRAAAERMRRIGVLLPAAADDSFFRPRRGVPQGLQQSGWTIGRNVQIDTRWATANAADIRRHAAELVALAPDVILAHGTVTVGPLLQATRTMPIVFAAVADPVGAGFVDSLARPGGNATGFMACRIRPRLANGWNCSRRSRQRVTRAAVLRDPPNRRHRPVRRHPAVAPSLGVEVSPVNVRDAAEIERAVTAFVRDCAMAA